MKEALPYIFLVGAAIAFLGAVASLITPRAAIFFKKDRLRGTGAWMAICIACLGFMGKSIPEEQREAAKAKRAAAEQVHLAPDPHESKDVPENSITFQYNENSVQNNSDRHHRIRGGTIYISPLDESSNLNSSQIASTCMAAAKYYAQIFSKKYNSPDNTLIDDILVVITDMPYDVEKYHREIYYNKIGQLGQCHFVIGKSTGLFSYGKPEWQWLEVKASPRNTSEIEKQVENLWIDLHKKFKQGNRIANDALKKEIGLKININPEAIKFTPVLPEKMDPQPFKNINPQGPAKAND